MEITNKYNLPEPIYRAVSQVYAPDPKRISVTSLIGPPLIRQLKIKHWDELEEDASERLWALLGKAMDKVLTEYAPKTWITQLKLEYSTNGITVVGVIDYLILAEKLVGDWKATSVWSYLLGGKIEWEKQLNCYDYLLTYSSINACKLEVNRFLRDHMASKALQNSDYPRIPFISLKIPQWPWDKQVSYVRERVRLHLSEPTECTAEEKWEKPTTYAVMKKGRRSALRVLDELAQAKTWCIDNKHGTFSATEKGAIKLNAGIEIVERPGECTRCLSYCPVRPVCPHNIYREENATNNKRANRRAAN